MEEQNEQKRRLAEKYFENRCSREEARQVLEWFDTPAGQAWLIERLEEDLDQLDRFAETSVEPLLSGEDSRRIWSGIRRRIRREAARPPVEVKSRDYLTIGMRAAASVLVILVASFFYHSIDSYQPDDSEIVEAPAYETISTGDEHRNVTLGDGSTVRLNRYTEIRIPSDYVDGVREIDLQAGEIYVDVVYDPERPFHVNAGQSGVEVLGTAFNLRQRSADGSEEIQVAVIEGSVAFSGKAEERLTERVVLEAGDFAYYTPADEQMRVEDYAVDNYLYWMSGRLRFQELPLEQVCFQLERIYGLNCEFQEAALADKRITSDFSNDSREKTLEVIGQTLGLEHRVENDRTVIWRPEE